MTELWTPYPFDGRLWIPYLSFFLAALTVKPSPYRFLLFIPIPPLAFYTLLSTTGQFMADYTLGLAWLVYFWFASDYILLTDVQRSLHHLPPSVKRAPGDAKPQPIESASLWRRFKWGLTLFISVRGVSWAHAPAPGIIPPPPPPGTSRTRFLVRRLGMFFIVFLIHDACNMHVRANSMFHSYYEPGWRGDGWAWRAAVVVTWGLSSATMMEMLCTLSSIVSVVLRFSEPEEWPALFGSPSDAYTVRRLWGRVWHQIMRRFVSTHGKFLAYNILHLKPGTNASSYVQLFTAFFLSTTIHYGAEIMAFRNFTGGAPAFFMLQPCIIMLEDFVLFLGRSAGIRQSKLLYRLGYLWVLAWFTLTLPIWEEPLVKAGQMRDGMGVSFWAGVWRGEWVLGEVGW
ncbi:MBOAT-2 domain-containing protein [Favolaschia claudopus]|uniref:MBOAT-2 domain-containing protein n=1 Tax=Favolaschia claudopus TaxID=2862362 RepID=A0AAW0BE32_9AGAR